MAPVVPRLASPWLSLFLSDSFFPGSLTGSFSFTFPYMLVFFKVLSRPPLLSSPCLLSFYHFFLMIIGFRKIKTKMESFNSLSCQGIKHPTAVAHSSLTPAAFPQGVRYSSALSPLRSEPWSPLHSKEALLKYKSDCKPPFWQTCKSCPLTTRSCPNSSWLS